jgi:hypothetical protein
LIERITVRFFATAIERELTLLDARTIPKPDLISDENKKKYI